MTKNINRIGLFDSGVGGLTVLKELLTLPFTEYVYVADTANVPYGQKTPAQILEFSKTITQFLITHEIDALVIACHTSSALALSHLEDLFPELPIIGTIRETMHHAVKQSIQGRIGIMATQASINSHLHKKELLAINPALEVFEVACPQLVPLIESSTADKKAITHALQEYLEPLLAQHIDTLILGCTHYPLLFKEIRALIGDDIVIVSSEKIIAQTLAICAVDTKAHQKNIVLYSTGDAQGFAHKAKAILDQPVMATHVPLHTTTQSIVESPVNLSNTL